MSMEYNGWTNYATWRVNLEVCADLVEGMARDDFSSVAGLAAYFEESVDEILTQYGEIESGLALDYARSFVRDVDWYEIAEHYAEDLIVVDDTEAAAEYMSDNPLDTD